MTHLCTRANVLVLWVMLEGNILQAVLEVAVPARRENSIKILRKFVPVSHFRRTKKHFQ